VRRIRMKYWKADRAFRVLIFRSAAFLHWGNRGMTRLENIAVNSVKGKYWFPKPTLQTGLLNNKVLADPGEL
jgi:hypothetical protein